MFHHVSETWHSLIKEKMSSLKFLSLDIQNQEYPGLEKAKPSSLVVIIIWKLKKDMQFLPSVMEVDWTVDHIG